MSDRIKYAKQWLNAAEIVGARVEATDSVDEVRAKGHRSPRGGDTMKMIASSFACVQQRRRPRRIDVAEWAADLLARPDLYGADERTCVIVADLAAQMAASR